MARRFSVLFLISLLSILALSASSASAASIFWANPVSGVWSDSSNWNPEQVPGPEDIAFISLAGEYTVTVDIDVDIDRLAIGASSGSQTVLVDGQSIAVSSGLASTIVQSGALEISNGGSFTGSSTLRNIASVKLDNGTIETALSNQGSLMASGVSSILGAVTTNGNSIIRIDPSSALTISDGFTNNNLILMTGDGSSMVVENGTLTNSAGSFITISGDGAQRTLTALLDNQGTVSINTDLLIDKDSAAHTNSGLVNCLGANLTVLQSGTDPSLTNTGEIRISSGRMATVDGGSFENAVGGLLSGAGTLDVTGTAFTQAGNLSPGSPTGILTVLGSYEQTATGNLQIEIGGLVGGDDYDRLDVSGPADLDGALSISLKNGFYPQDGDSFEILSFDAVSGAFADTSSLDLGGGIRLVQQVGESSLILVATTEPSVIEAVAPEGCITPSDPCVTVPFQILQSNPQEVRAYSVTFSINSDLRLCEGLNSIAEGPFLSGFCGGGCTAFQVNDNHDGSFTVDATILGGDCGPDSSGTLFTVDFTHTGSDGVGTVEIIDVEARDCSNGSLSVSAGLPIEIGIDVAVPPMITDLTATQIKSGNDADGTTTVVITFTGDIGGDTLEIYRKGFGDYPEYEDGVGQVPTPPSTPEEAVADGWVLTEVTSSGGLDDPPARDYWYYIAFITSPCDLASVSNMTEGALNYHLGDVSDGVDTCAGDNLVGTIDVSFLGANYFKTGTDVDPVNCLDFGPTTDGSVDGRPQPDNAINFEELVLIGINFGEVGAPKRIASPKLSSGLTPDALALILVTDDARIQTEAGRDARVILEGNEDLVKGIHSVVTYDPAKQRLVGVQPGQLLDEQNATIFFDWMEADGQITIDAAVLGRDQTLSGSGEVAVLQFATFGSANRPTLAIADLRDLANRHLLDAGIQPSYAALIGRTDPQTALSVATALIGARPNPFEGATEIAFTLATATDVTLQIYDVAGRLIRTLIDDRLPAGGHAVSWNGRNESGRDAPAGVYLYSFRTAATERTEKIILRR